MFIRNRVRSAASTDKVFAGLIFFLLLFNATSFYILWNDRVLWYDIFGVWSRQPYQLLGIFTSVYSHAGIFHFAKNLISLMLAWVLLRDSHQIRTSRFVLVFCTLIGVFTSFITMLALVFYLNVHMVFVGSSTFTHGLLLFSLIVGDFTFLTPRRNTITKIGIGGWLIGYEVYRLVQNGIVISGVAHVTSFLCGLIMVWIWFRKY